MPGRSRSLIQEAISNASPGMVSPPSRHGMPRTTAYTGGRTSNPSLIPPSVFTAYKIGLQILLNHIDHSHNHYSEILTYEQRLNENIDLSALYGDTETRRAERAQIIDQLNSITLSALGVSFNELCPVTAVGEPHEHAGEAVALDQRGAVVEVFAPRDLYITTRLPREAAIMHVYAHGPDQYRVWCGNAEDEPVHTKRRKDPHLALADMIHRSQRAPEEAAQQIQDRIGEFSHSNLHIRTWIKELRLRFGEDLYLIIADYTNFEIPWELLELAYNEYVGALVTIVRWQQVIGEEDIILLEVKPDECAGSIVAYVDREQLEWSAAELETLRMLDVRAYDDIKGFREHLQREDSPVALVYMACGCIYDQDISRMAIGSHTNEQQRLRFADLRRRSLDLLKSSRSVVFLNADHSGRLQTDEHDLRDSYRRGFAELFLGKGARGVIGTLGAVDPGLAAHIARDLIVEALRVPDRPIATILRDLRARVVNRLPDDPAGEDLLALIFTFMYVYYGNPLTVLRLAKRKE